MEFELKKLSDLCLKITDGSHYSPKEVLGGIPMYSVKDMTAYGFSDSSVKRISEEEYEALVKADCTPRVNDVLIAKDGSVLKHVFAIGSEVKGALLSSIAILRPNPNYLDSDFLVYSLQDPYLRNDVLSNYVSGSGVPRIVLKDFKNISIRTPSLGIQRSIAKTLKALDKKIQINKAISQNLEDIAQTLFESWFVDFDPVKAKLARKTPADMDEATAKLFPDSMVESELGLIPSGWENVAFDEMFTIVSGGTPKTTNAKYWNGDIPWFSVVDAPEAGECFFIRTAKTITQEGLDNSAAKLVRPGVTVISARGTVGKTAIVATPSAFNQSCYGVDGKYGDFFTYLLLRNQIKRLQSISHGGMFDTITRETFSSLKVLRPSLKLITEFESTVESFFMQIKSLQFQNHALSDLRDSLLPRLISGELQLAEDKLDC